MRAAEMRRRETNITEDVQRVVVAVRVQRRAGVPQRARQAACLLGSGEVCRWNARSRQRHGTQVNVVRSRTQNVRRQHTQQRKGRREA